jgi:predicted O-linked N-acetylglucosamine transferase (SPINDLY family)
MPSQPYLLMPAVGSDIADEWHRSGLDAHISGNLPLAQQRYQQALRLDPRHALATQNLACVFAQSGLMADALLTIERAALLDGKYPSIKTNWSIMAQEVDQIDEALKRAEEAHKLEPSTATRIALTSLYPSVGRPADAIPLYNEILDTEPKHPSAGTNACFLQTLTDCGPADLLKQRQKWCAANRQEGSKQPHTNDRSLDRPLRVGYVGGDFKQHSAAFIFAHVLLHHSPAVEMYLYSSLPVDAMADARTKAFQAACGIGQCTVSKKDGSDSKAMYAVPDNNRWRDISAMNDEDAEKLIRQDKIDILVDLAAHTNGGRLPLFTRKPAPVQVTAWGFAHGTGCPEIDYFLADPVAIPEVEREHYAEKIYDLPCIVTMDPPVEYALNAASQPPLKKNGYITFGSFTRFEKMSDECLRAFAEVLRQVPESRLILKDRALRRPFSLRRVMSFMDWIEPERVLLSLDTNHPDHMLAYQQCDIFLNPFPHSSGAVSSEVLWMGVPMLTLYGQQAAGRSAASILTAMGRPEWIAYSPAEYIAKAVEWADKPKELAASRKTLRQELLDSPVVARYVEKVEEAYREMWRLYAQS